MKRPVLEHPRKELCSLAFAALLLPSLPSLAAENKLEDEMFGGGSAAASESGKTAEPVKSPDTTVTTRQTQGETLTLGGRLELQSVLSKGSNSSAAEARMLNSTGAELYLDSRPADNLRGYIKGSVTSRGNAQNQPAFSVNETWIKWNGTSVYTTLGKQKLKWGAATFWNPSDFFAVEAKDPFALYDVRAGANLLKLHMPFEKSGNNFYLLANFDNAQAARDSKFAARAELNYGLGELTATVAGGRDQPQQYAFDVNTALGPVDLVVETALTRKSKRDFFRRSTSADGSQPIISYKRDNQTIAQVVGGLRYDIKYSESDSANLSVEYFWNDFGSSNALSEAVSFLRGQAQRLYLANRYVAANILLAQPASLNDSTVLVSGLTNLTDKSWLVRGSWSERVSQKSTLNIALARSGGAGEFTGGIPSSIANEVIRSSDNAEFNKLIRQFEASATDWTLTMTAGIEL
ncbi:MAG: hypothetical protein RLZZ488_1764 [Pseudomonadota bacterium]|jgi:hypothetical protein